MIRLRKSPNFCKTLCVLSFVLLVLKVTPASGQASNGYTKIAATNGLSYIDTSVTPGAVYDYQVTAYNAAGESTAVTTSPAVIPSIVGTHSVTIAWIGSAVCSATVTTACGGTPTGYNVYRVQFVIPYPPGSASATSGP
jgi:hypothetical protein